MAITINSALTDKAREKIAQMLISGESFTVDTFTVSDGGHDPVNPIISLAPDPTVLELPTLTGFEFGPKSITTKRLVNIYTPVFTCVLEKAEAVGGISNIGLWATPLVGDPFLFALGNRGLSTKTDSEQWVMNISVAY